MLTVEFSLLLKEVHPVVREERAAAPQKDEAIDELRCYCDSTRDDGAAEIGFHI